MADREKVIKGFENCVFNHCDDDCMYKDEEWKDSGFSACRHFAVEDIVEMPRRVLLDVLELIKSQEPRVMTLEEACSDIDFCWLEIKDYQAVWVSDCVIMPNGKQVLIERLGYDPVSFKPEEYGRTWRCWENKPTDDQMGAVKWDK